MPNTKDLILQLKAVRDEKGYSLGDIMRMMEENGDYLSKATLSRIFADGSEDVTFRYEATIRPIANALLDIENIEADDTMDTRAMKSLLKYKNEKIEELEQKIKDLEAALNKEKVKSSEKLEKEREHSRKSIEFLKEQVSYKDKRMDFLLESVKEKDALHREMLDKLLKCSACPNS